LFRVTRGTGDLNNHLDRTISIFVRKDNHLLVTMSNIKANKGFHMYPKRLFVNSVYNVAIQVDTEHKFVRLLINGTEKLIFNDKEFNTPEEVNCRFYASDNFYRATNAELSKVKIGEF